MTLKKSKTELPKFWGMVTVGCMATGLQYVAVKICSKLFMRYVLTGDFIGYVTSSPGHVLDSIPLFRKMAWMLGHFLIGVAYYNQFIIGFIFMVLVAWLLFRREEINSKVSITMFVLAGILVGTAFLVGSGTSYWNWGTFIFLAECTPLWAWLTVYFMSGFLNDPNIKYQTHGEFQRGVKLVQYNNNSKAFAQLTAMETPKGGKAGIQIVPNEPFPYTRENQHDLILGSPGSGKTQIIFPMKLQAIQRGDKLISWDVKGTDIQALAGETGIDLLAAWDQRSIGWSPGADIKSQLDCKEMADILMPPNPKDAQPFFLNSARQILEAVLMYLLQEKGSNWGWGDVWAILSKKRKDLARLLSSFKDGDVAASFISSDSKSSDDVYSTLMSQAQQTIRWYAKAWPRGGVSLREWIHSDSKVLILGGIPQRADLAKATANIAIEIIVNAILSLPDDPNRRIWLFLDELATLGKLDVLLNAFSLGRSKGLCVVAGIQDIGKIEHIYGYNLAKSITNTFSTMIVLRCSDVETSQWASNVLGEQDIIETQRSSGSSSKGWGEGTVTSTHEQKVPRTRKLFTASEIAHFPNLDGVMRVSGWPLLDLRWPYRPIPQTKPIVVDANWINGKDNSTDSPVDPLPEDPST